MEPTPQFNQIEIVRIQEKMKLYDYRQEQLDKTAEQTLRIQGNTQKQLDDFVDVATKHFAQARIVHKIVYGMLGTVGTIGAGYFLPKIFQGLINFLAQ